MSVWGDAVQLRAWGLIAGVTTVVVVVGIALTLPARDNGEAPTDPPQRDQPVEIASPEAESDEAALTPARARELEAGINERDPDSLVDVAVLDDDDDPVEVAAAVLPPGSLLAIDESSFERLTPHGAAVEGVITGADGTWHVQLWLAHHDSRWMLSGSTNPELADAEPAE